MYENNNQHLILGIHYLDLGPNGERYIYQLFKCVMESQPDLGQDSLLVFILLL